MIIQSIKDMLRLSECGHITNKRKIPMSLLMWVFSCYRKMLSDFLILFTENLDHCIYGGYILSIKPRYIYSISFFDSKQIISADMEN